jgi:hypothetical protein
MSLPRATPSGRARWKQQSTCGAADLRPGRNLSHRRAVPRARQSPQGSLRSRRPSGRGGFQPAPGSAGNAPVRQRDHRRRPADLLARRNQETRPQDGRGDHRTRLADPEEVLQCLAAQARKRIVDCLRWDEGSYTFTPAIPLATGSSSTTSMWRNRFFSDCIAAPRPKPW